MLLVEPEKSQITLVENLLGLLVESFHVGVELLVVGEILTDFSSTKLLRVG